MQLTVQIDSDLLR